MDAEKNSPREALNLSKCHATALRDMSHRRKSFMREGLNLCILVLLYMIETHNEHLNLMYSTFSSWIHAKFIFPACQNTSSPIQNIKNVLDVTPLVPSATSKKYL